MKCRQRSHGFNAAQFIRRTDEGWKLQTAQEKSWETERRGYLAPKPREQNDIRKQSLAQIFDEAEFKTYRYQTYRTFRVGINFDGTHPGDEADLPLISLRCGRRRRSESSG